MRMNYYFAISSLILLKNRHHLIKNQKNASVLEYLSAIDLKDDHDSDTVPNAKMIGMHLNMPLNKVHDVLYNCYLDLVKSLGEHPHPVAECIHAIYVNIPCEKNEDQKARERLRESFLYAEFNLPVTPRLGEHIRIEFLDRDIKYTYGVVTEVHHEIRAHTQRILIYVDPFNNFYWKWEKLKQDHQEHERWEKYASKV